MLAYLARRLLGACSSTLTNTLCCCGPLTGRLKIVTSPGEPARMCDFGDGGIMDNTGVAAAIARGSTKIMSMVTPAGPFRPPTKAFLMRLRLGLERATPPHRGAPPAPPRATVYCKQAQSVSLSCYMRHVAES